MKLRRLCNATAPITLQSHLSINYYCFKLSYSLLIYEVFFRCEERRERKKRREKTSGSGQWESHYHATIGVN